MKNTKTLSIEQAAKRFPSLREILYLAKKNGATVLADKPVRNSSGRVINHILKVKTAEGYENLDRYTFKLLLLSCIYVKCTS